MDENFLKYTELTFNSIYKQIFDKINSDSRFDNPRESSIFQTIIELFAGCTDIINYYIQRRAEECYFDTANLKSSIILLSRMLGYDITRPIPAKCKIKIILKGNFEDIFDSTNGADNKIQIPYYTKFYHDNSDFLLIDTFTYNVSPSVLQKMIDDGDDFEMELVKDSFNNDIYISQGEIRERIIVGNTNTQVGNNFQMYKIEDKEFSNIYGENDFFFNAVTKVFVGVEKDSTTQYQIDRNSLINWESMNTNDLSKATKLCLIRTTPDEFIELVFGDGSFAAKGALTRMDNIYIQYLATNGSKGNKVGVIGDSVNFSGKIYTNTGFDISDKVQFKILSNIIGGADIESNESIKYSSPKIYNSLKRIVSKSDYINYLKNIKSPMHVRNALAWGEQEERDLAGVFADIKMFNVTLFSVVGSLYHLNREIFTVKTKSDGLDTAVLDIDYDPYNIQIQSYFNVYTRQAIALQLKKYIVSYYYKKHIGVDLGLTHNGVFYKNVYGNNGKFDFWYRSDINDNASNIITSGSVIIDFSSLDDTSTNDDVANKISEALDEFKDARANYSDNKNYKLDAFDCSAVWKEESTQSSLILPLETRRFEIDFGIDSQCYIISAFGSLADDLGINKEISYIAKLENDEISGNIIDVIGQLDSRSQLNIKNIYVSPIIHNFNIDGVVYIKPLYDKESTKTEINNKIYEWLDINADFNKSVSVSNIVDIIENHSGVINTNIRIVPEDITNGINNTDNKYYYSWKDDTINLYGDELWELFFGHLSTFLTNNNSSHKEIKEKRSFYNKKENTIEIYILEDKKYYLHNYINERNFINVFLKKLFNDLLKKAETQKNAFDPLSQNNYVYQDVDGNLTINYKRFIGYNSPNSQYNSFNKFYVMTTNCDFVKAITKIHKDLSYIIKLNMIDTHGNIEAEYDSVGNYIRGGYSLGSEICKFSLQSLKYQYK